MNDFAFSLTNEEKAYLKDLVFWSIRQRLEGRSIDHLPEPPTIKLTEPLGAFVTLKIKGHLRGCIGQIIGEKPLNRTIAQMAQAAAFNDPRFPRLTEEEFKEIEVEISILSPLAICPDPSQIEVGKHGLLVSLHGRSGLLLPQVATEYGWDSKAFLRRTCEKAGLPASAALDPNLQIFWFQAEVF